MSTGRRNVRRRALIIGINEYQNPNNNLNGCVADAIDMAETLKIMGFPPRFTKLLINEQASTDGILKGLDWLTKDTADGDVLIFHYSGHGSQVADLNDDEHDKLDEIIVPYDISWRDHKYITDDQLFDYFTNKVPKGVRTDALLDCCFAGTGTRTLGNGGVGALQLVDKDTRSQRYLPPPVDQAFRINSMIPSLTDFKYFSRNLIESGTTGKTTKGQQVVNQNNVLWAAAQDYQLAWELLLGGEVRGAFTYYFTRIIRRANGNITRGQAYSILRSSMYSDGFEQIPALEVPNAEAIELFPFRKESEVDRMSEVKTK